MCKKLIFLIFICLSCNFTFSKDVNFGIINSYLNDKIIYSDKSDIYFTQELKNYNMYQIGGLYKVQFDNNIYFKTSLDYGFGSTYDTSFKNFDENIELKEYKSKQKILNYTFNLKYLYRIGPLRLGPLGGFTYNLQSIKNDLKLEKLGDKESIEWYLPNIGMMLNLQPNPNKSWRLYSSYDFSIGRFKMHSLYGSYYRELANRHKLLIGTLFSSKRLETELNFIYKHYRSGYDNKKLQKLVRESFEGNITLSYKF